MQESIGLFGGSFNPIHIGHLILADEARIQFNLDRIIFIPNNLPPHRPVKHHEWIDAETRYIMAILATSSNPFFDVSPIELRRQGISYSYDTVSELKQSSPEHRYYFIAGADTLTKYQWAHFDELFDLLEGFLLTSRGEESLEKVNHKLHLSSSESSKKVLGINMPSIEISSTKIRERVCAKKSIRYLVPENVEQYIFHHRLYIDSDK